MLIFHAIYIINVLQKKDFSRILFKNYLFDEFN